MKDVSMRKLIVPLATTLVLGALAMNANAGSAAYWYDQSGKVVRSGTGTCVRTINWAPELVTAECDSSAPKFTTRKVTMDADALFDFDQSTIKPDGKLALDEVVRKLNLEGAELGLIVSTGHTDSTGGTAYNMDLSKRRAESVKTYLVSKGIDGDRINTVGEGEHQPVADNATAGGRDENRHVEIEVTSTRTTK